MENLNEVMRLLEQGTSQLRALVVGDVMLDKYVWGDVARISPEAPVPIVRVARRHEQPGGAANVAMNLAGLGAQVVLFGFAGGDSDHEALESCLHAAGVVCQLTTIDKIPTTSKLRILGGSQQMMRLDIESNVPHSVAAYDQLLQRFNHSLATANVVILSDYAKGVLTEEVCRTLIEAARAVQIPILVDPKSVTFDRYYGATTICPNLHELSLSTGESSRELESVLAAGQRMVEKFGLSFLTVTLSEKGIAVLYPDRRALLPALARNVFDVSGAGDTVIATLALCAAGGLPIETAAQLANMAAGIVVGRVGTVPVQKHELLAALTAATGINAEEKVLQLNHLLARVSAWRAAGDRIVFTNGCFDILHIGHISLLAAARRQGDRLVVGINSDASVQRLKGPSRPLVGARERAQVLSAVSAVDAVIVFEEDTPHSLIRAVRPEVLVKGGDYTEATVVGADEVRSWGGIVKIVPTVQGFSTTKIIAMAAAHQENNS
jgi:D-beta-D-heptose 7-phosphate kinase/D-beta-D-heptose 1-phosphate adenosyltransferase